jgi:[FeFe] hydrogenase H-cluster maturation GTPase HydF
MAILVERDNIGIFGRMNAGKSTIMNLITQQETSIVDPTPGTTADTKISLFELHGMGPVRVFDTAGLDETSELGLKKRKKVLDDLKEIDLILLVINPANKNLEVETEIVNSARELGKQLILVYNLFDKKDASFIEGIQKALPSVYSHKTISLNATDASERKRLVEFLLKEYESKTKKIELLPFLKKDEYYILLIPMDDETPPGRYLRPQAMVEEYITRHWAYPVSFRPDLGMARSKDQSVSLKEKERFLKLVNGLPKRPHAIITDSQAMDVFSKWCPEDILLTTFSITMINFMSKGKLNEFAEGTKTLDSLKKGDTALIVEACNHSRIGEDIGTVQIPNYINKHFPGVKIEHNFGREFLENRELKKYKLIIHCGGCMVSHQELAARIRELESVGVPFTNYGLFLSYIQGKEAFNKVLQPWGIDSF